MNSFKFGVCAITMLFGLTVHANEVKIVDATATQSGDSWTVAVTLDHADDGKHHADLWQIVTEDGTILGVRELGHAHKNRIFTKDLEGVKIPSSVSVVYIEAHDNVHGWAKEKFTLKLAKELQVGDRAPAFQAKNQEGKPWKLEEHVGAKYVVLYFYPAAMTGGCTKQACSYRDHKNKAGGLDIEIVGISGDTPESLKFFQQANQLNFTLLSDPDGAIAKKYGVPVREGQKSIQRTVDGKEVTLERSNTAARWTFIIDRQGKIIYRDIKVKATEDLNNIMEFIQKTEG